MSGNELRYFEIWRECGAENPVARRIQRRMAKGRHRRTNIMLGDSWLHRYG